jgi:hypothetical protein
MKRWKEREGTFFFMVKMEIRFFGHGEICSIDNFEIGADILFSVGLSPEKNIIFIIKKIEELQ